MITMFLRIVTRKSSPAQYIDPPVIVSINQLIKNAVVYSLAFTGMYLYLAKNWKKENFMLQISPFVFLATILFEFALRLLEFLLDVKGIRYLAQSITLFLLFILTI